MQQTPAPPSRQDPSDLRLRIRQARAAMSAAERVEKNRRLLTAIDDWLRSRRFQTIALYLPFDGEPDLRPLAKRLREAGGQPALPVIDPRRAGRMRFHLWPEDARLLNNRFGIPEPLETPPAGDIDLLLAPLVAFDPRGNRLGMGGGYYDRWLAGCRNRPVFAGTGWQLQRVERLRPHRRDVPLDMIFTEKGRFSFPSGEQ